MEAWSVEVPRARAEEIRLRLREKGLLRDDLRIAHAADRVHLPTVERVEMGFPTLRRSFDPIAAAARTYKDLVAVPDALRPSLPSSFDVIGDIAVLKIPDPLVEARAEIGRAILAWNRSLRVVAADRGVKGEYRVRDLEVIAGERRTETVHVEYGLRYRVDVARAYFSPRLGTERKRVADQVREGEAVLDPFAGVGPYAVLIGRTRRPSRVVASDANPEAVAFLRANVAANRTDRVHVLEGEARTIMERTAPFDRVILDLPHTALDFFGDAVRALRDEGTVHLYAILGQADRENRAQKLRYLVEREGCTVEDLRLHTVRAYSPTQHHVAFDVTVGRGKRPVVPDTSPTSDRTSPTPGTQGAGTRSVRTAPRSAPRAGPRTRSARQT